jgi:hypothetical protein
VINVLLVAVSEEQLRSNLRGDLPLVILGSVIAAIGVAAVVVQLARWKSGERVLLWWVIRRPIRPATAHEHHPIPDGLR